MSARIIACSCAVLLIALAVVWGPERPVASHADDWMDESALVQKDISIKRHNTEQEQDPFQATAGKKLHFDDGDMSRGYAYETLDMDQMGDFMDHHEKTQKVADAELVKFEAVTSGKSAQKAFSRYVGKGHCKKQYLGGWDGFGGKSLEDCTNFCLQGEPGCRYVSFIGGKTDDNVMTDHLSSCSRYGEKCNGKVFEGKPFSLDADHVTYEVSAHAFNSPEYALQKKEAAHRIELSTQEGERDRETREAARKIAAEVALTTLAPGVAAPLPGETGGASKKDLLALAAAKEYISTTPHPSTTAKAADAKKEAPAAKKEAAAPTKNMVDWTGDLKQPAVEEAESASHRVSVGLAAAVVCAASLL